MADENPSSLSRTQLTEIQKRYDEIVAKRLQLDMQRGQPSNADFDLSNGLLTAVTPGDTTVDGVEIRNYSGPAVAAGLPAARALFGDYLNLPADNVLVWNNSSLELQGMIFGFALLHGLPASDGGWARSAEKPKIVVTVPGYDRHFLLLETAGFELITVQMESDGPDVAAIAEAAQDPAVKGVVFVPTYSNPTGDTISPAKAAQLAAIEAAAPDFTIFADDAYRGHLLAEEADERVNLVELSAAAGHPDRAFVFGSTSKITYAGAGLGFVGSSEANITWLKRYLGAQSIGPNKLEQARHVKFLSGHAGGIDGLMQEHRALIAPKFAAVDAALTSALGAGGGGYATWKVPNGGYFISLDTVAPVADRVVELAAKAGVKVTPAGATFPKGQDPNNANIRLAPTRPPRAEVTEAMDVVAVCIKLATEEYRRTGGNA